MSIYSNNDRTYIQTPNTDVCGHLLIYGDLTVQGQTSTVHSTIVTVSDLNIELAYDATTPQQADGGGITVAGADARIEYRAEHDRWTFNKDIESRAMFVEDLTFTGTGPVDIASGNDLYFYSPGQIRSRSRDFTIEASDSIDLDAIYQLSADARIITARSETLSLSSTATTTLTSNQTVLESNELTANIHGGVNINGDVAVTLNSDNIVLNGTSIRTQGTDFTIQSDTFSVATHSVAHIGSDHTITLDSGQDINVNSAAVNLTAVNVINIGADTVALTGSALTINDYAMPAAKGQLEQVLTASGLTGDQAEWKSLSDVAWSGSYNDLLDLPDLTVYATNVALQSLADLHDQEFTTLLNGISDETARATSVENALAAGIALKANSADLAPVATSGSYNDLIDKPAVISKAELKDIVAASTDFADFQARIAGLL